MRLFHLFCAHWWSVIDYFYLKKRAHGLNKYLKNCIKFSDFIKCWEFSDRLKKFWHIKKDTTEWNLAASCFVFLSKLSFSLMLEPTEFSDKVIYSTWVLFLAYHCLLCLGNNTFQLRALSFGYDCMSLNTALILKMDAESSFEASVTMCIYQST